LLLKNIYKYFKNYLLVIKHTFVVDFLLVVLLIIIHFINYNFLKLMYLNYLDYVFNHKFITFGTSFVIFIYIILMYLNTGNHTYGFFYIFINMFVTIGIVWYVKYFSIIIDFTITTVNYINSFIYIDRDYLILEDHLIITNYYLIFFILQIVYIRIYIFMTTNILYFIYVICIRYIFKRQTLLYLTFDEFNAKYIHIFSILFVFNIYYLITDIARRIFIYLHKFFF
jgi:hypothetical protein